MVQLAIVNEELANTLVICTVIVIAKMLLTNFATVYPNAISGSCPPEDSWLWRRLLGKSAPAQQSHGIVVDAQHLSLKDKKPAPPDGTDAAVRRTQRVVGNNLENIPVSLMALWLAGMTVKSEAGISELIFLVKVFTVSRCIYTVCYLMQITLLRSIIFMAGLASVFRALYLTVMNVMQ